MSKQSRRIPVRLSPPAIFLGAMLVFAAMAGHTLGQEKAANDTDGDGLPDGWEMRHFGNLQANPGDDTDGDSLTNLLESEIGSDPRLVDSDRDGHPDWMGIPGYLLQEKWPEPEASAPLVISPRQKLNRPGASQFFHPGAAVKSAGDNFFRQRLRGTITAPATGDYEFWIAGDNGCELWLGIDESRFGARRLAGLPRDDSRTQPKEWDKYPSQKSQAVTLQAGRKYYVEILHRDFRGYDHVAIAWKAPGGVREPVPARVFTSWVQDPDDTDDDGMSDRWEAANGLVVGKQDAMEDPDGDGIDNLREHDVGSDPQSAGAVPGMLDWSRWSRPQGQVAPERLLADARAKEPERSEAVHGLKLPANVHPNAIDRFSGTLTAPEDGHYSFWIMGKRPATLSLSPDSHSFNKRMIARISPNSGLYVYDENNVPSARSMPVRLKKGGKYFIDAMLATPIGTPPPVNIGWQRHEARQWTEAELGGVRNGSWAERDGAVVATAGAGSGFGGNQGDAVWFRHSPVAGAVEAICRMDSLHELRDGSGGGLMLRSSDDPYAPFVSVTIDSRMRISFHRRTEALELEGSAYEGASLAGALRSHDSVWLRLRSDGKECLALFSVDGLEWLIAGRIKLALGGEPIGGPVAWGGPGDGASEITFSDLVIGDMFPSGEVPGEVLSTRTPDPEDVDGDSLPDAWEIQHGLDATSAYGSDGEVGDPDGDGLSNSEEHRLGSDPQQAGGVPGFLTLDHWKDIKGSRVSDLLESRKFKGDPDITSLVARPDLEGLGQVNHGQRLRGTLIAPASGTYRFWISGDNGCSLSLSTDTRRSGLREIASISGTGGAVTGLHEWDKFASQASGEIELTGGQEYFIQILHKKGGGSDHVAVAWEYRTTGGTVQEREIIPSQALKSHVKDLEDIDEDGLPDEWEFVHGLSPEDNGFYDALREGAVGDHDQDGLTNLEEYRLGTHPCVADTDGDGVSDLDEVRLYGSDPTVRDASPPEVVADIPLALRVSNDLRWAYSPEDGSIRSMDRRGLTRWEFEVERAGVYQVTLHGWSESASNPSPSIPVSLEVDGIGIGHGLLASGPGATRISRMTRWLAAGRHEIGIYNHNVSSGVSMVISSLEILAQTGDDTNANGLPDWMESHFRALNGVQVPGGGFATSPACIEGNVRFFEDLSLGMADGTRIEARPGLSGQWYANVPLDPSGAAVTLEASYEGGAVAGTHDFVWAETNLYASYGDFHVRLGDAMRLTAYDPQGKADGTEFGITMDGKEIHRGTASVPHVVRFDKEGRHEMSVDVVAADGGRSAKTVVFVVHRANLGGDFHVPSGAGRVWVPDALPALAEVGHDTNLSLFEVSGTEGSPRSFEASFGTTGAGSARVLARLPGGAVLDAATIHGFYLASATRTGDHRLVRVLADGTRVIRVSYVIDGVIPPDFWVWIQLYVPDALFANGSSWLRLTAADFDGNGRAEFEIYKAPGTGIPYVCHWIRPYGKGPDESPEGGAQ